MIAPYYDHGGIAIYHGDAARILPLLKPVDLLLTDPPYGIGEARKNHVSRGGRTRFGGKGTVVRGRDYGPPSEWDDAPPPRWLIDHARSLAKHQIIFGGNYFELPPSKCWLVWDKDNGATDFADCELAWTNLDRAVRRIVFRQQGMLTQPGFPKEERHHPTQKPEPVMRWALSHVPDARMVLDPFMGSGTTLRAAKDAGLTAIGIERDERYCEVAAKRMSQEVLTFQERA